MRNVLNAMQDGMLKIASSFPLGIYDYWRETVTLGLNKLLLKQKNNIVLNLASSEYFDVIDRKKLAGKIVHVEFKVYKDNEYSIF